MNRLPALCAHKPAELSTRPLHEAQRAAPLVRSSDVFPSRSACHRRIDGRPQAKRAASPLIVRGRGRPARSAPLSPLRLSHSQVCMYVHRRCSPARMHGYGSEDAHTRHRPDRLFLLLLAFSSRVSCRFGRQSRPRVRRRQFSVPRSDRLALLNLLGLGCLNPGLRTAAGGGGACCCVTSRASCVPRDCDLGPLFFFFLFSSLGQLFLRRLRLVLAA